MVNGSSDVMREDTSGVVTSSADWIVAACIACMRADTDGVVATSADGIAGDVTRASAECVVMRSEDGVGDGMRADSDGVVTCH